MKKALLIALASATAFVPTACDDDDPGTGKIEIHFQHQIDREPVVYNEMRYTNAAGNNYEVTEIQWFISDVSLITPSGTAIHLNKDEFCHYIDTNLPDTWVWNPSDKLPTGQYEQIKFTFGLKGEKNSPGLFPDLPESNMVWPYAMGGENGGYHYMKLNGFWINPSAQRMPFNFHLGVGQIYDSEGAVIEFIQNWFEVTLPFSLEVRTGSTSKLELAMNVESWFDTPLIYDHNQFGSMIMKNQEAMGVIAQNGRDAFSVSIENSY